MKISIFYDHILQAAEQTGKEISFLLQEAKAAGIDAVEINMTYLDEHRETYDLLMDAQLAVSCVYEFYEMDSRDETARAKLHVKTARKAGADKILVVPGFFSEEEASDYSVCIQDYAQTTAFLTHNTKACRMAEGMSQLTALAKAQGIQVVIEDFDHICSHCLCKRYEMVCRTDSRSAFYFRYRKFYHSRREYFYRMGCFEREYGSRTL